MAIQKFTAVLISLLVLSVSCNRAGKVRMDLLLRSGNLSKASDEAVATLRDKYKLALVADFRSSMERGKAPDRDVEGAKNVWLSLALHSRKGQMRMGHGICACGSWSGQIPDSQ